MTDKTSRRYNGQNAHNYPPPLTVEQSMMAERARRLEYHRLIAVDPEKARPMDFDLAARLNAEYRATGKLPGD